MVRFNHEQITWSASFTRTATEDENSLKPWCQDWTTACSFQERTQTSFSKKLADFLPPVMVADCYHECDSSKMESLLWTPGLELRFVSCNVVDFFSSCWHQQTVAAHTWCRLKLYFDFTPRYRVWLLVLWCHHHIVWLRQHICCCCWMFLYSPPPPYTHTHTHTLPLPLHNGANLIVNYHCPHPSVSTHYEEPVRLL